MSSLEPLYLTPGQLREKATQHAIEATFLCPTEHRADALLISLVRLLRVANRGRPLPEGAALLHAQQLFNMLTDTEKHLALDDERTEL